MHVLVIHAPRHGSHAPRHESHRAAACSADGRVGVRVRMYCAVANRAGRRGRRPMQVRHSPAVSRAWRSPADPLVVTPSPDGQHCAPAQGAQALGHRGVRGVRRAESRTRAVPSAHSCVRAHRVARSRTLRQSQRVSPWSQCLPRPHQHPAGFGGVDGCGACGGCHQRAAIVYCGHRRRHAKSLVGVGARERLRCQLRWHESRRPRRELLVRMCPE
mmetsp:Transcript_53908/g.139306  ORF Transcript_53908/g.139306 Transcript_53908/m.139306 type:complete len:216 (-) Transcript_53908:50-697(-)